MPGPAAFEAIATRLDYPMLVVTTVAGGERSGCLVGFSTQCSINPPRYLIGLSDKNHTHHVARHATHLAAHLLTPAETGLAELFGEETGDRIDKFTRCPWTEGPGGVPLLTGAAGWFAGPILEQWVAGDHRCFVIEVTAADHRGDEQFLSFRAVKDMEPGHEP